MEEHNVRDLAKSMLRLPWAMSMFGLRQISQMADPDRGWNESQASMNAVSHTAESQMGDSAGSFYRAWDHLQSGLVDAMFDLTFNSWNDPRKAMNDTWSAIDRSWSSASDEISNNEEK